jgi:hypothetical protein
VALEVAVGAGLHGVVLEGGELVERGVEGEGETAAGVVVSGEGFGDGGASFFAGVPGFEDGGGVLLGVVDGDGAAVLEDDDDGFPGCGEGFEELFLDGGEGDGGAIAAGEAIEFDGHLFAFEGGGEAGEEEDGVGGAADFDGFVAEDLGGGLPGEIDAGGARAVEVFEADGVGFGVVEVDGRGDLGAAFAGFAGGVGEELVVDEEAEGFEVLAGVAGVDAGTEAVVTGCGWGEGAGPADGVVVAGEAGDGDDFIPVEVDDAVGAGEDGGAGEVFGGEVLAGEAVAGAGFWMEPWA